MIPRIKGVEARPDKLKNFDPVGGFKVVGYEPVIENVRNTKPTRKQIKNYTPTEKFLRGFESKINRIKGLEFNGDT